MNQNIINRLKGAFLVTSVLFGAVACSDDHFDVQLSGNAGESLIQNIRATGELNDFATILERTTVMRTDNDKNATINYAQLLGENQNITVWAPKDGTYDASKYLTLLDQADEAKASNNLVLFRELNRTVENQFVRNHMARANYETTAADQRVSLMNDKRCVYNAGEGLFNDVALDKAFGTIPSSNGMLHVLNGVSPFAFNIYDYMKENSEWSAINDYIHSEDTLYFSASSSIEGTIIDGEMVYVDSVFVTSSPLSVYLGNISSEDSTYVAVLPNNEAWEAAFEKYKSYFKYGENYNYNWNTENGEFLNTSKNGKGYVANVDSLEEVGTRTAILSSLVFSATQFPGVDVSDSAAIINYALTADSLISTCYINVYRPEGQSVNPYFGNGQPLKASNGYIFTVDNYNIDAIKSWQNLNPIDYDAEYTSYNVYSSNVGNRTVLSLDETSRDSSITGIVHNDSYIRFERGSRSRMVIDFSLYNVMSAKYDVYIVMMPSAINKNYTDDLGEGVVEDPQFDASIIMDDGTTLETVKDIHVNTDSVSHICLFENLPFPKSYFNLPVTSFPRLRLTVPAYTDDVCKALNIDRIYLVPKGNDENE